MASISVSFNVSSGSGNYRVELINCSNNSTYTASGLTNPQNFPGQATSGTVSLAFALPQVTTTYSNVKFRIVDVNDPNCSSEDSCRTLSITCGGNPTCSISGVSTGNVSC